MPWNPEHYNVKNMKKEEVMKILEENKYDPHFYGAEDREYFLRLFGKVKFIRVNQPLYFITEYKSINYYT